MSTDRDNAGPGENHPGEGDERTPKDRDLWVEIYDALRAVAGAKMRGERANHTLQPTALVNEAFAKLGAMADEFESRGHLLALMAQAMHRVLIDYARSYRAEKRGGGVLVNTGLDPTHAKSEIDVLELDEAIERLAKDHSDAARVVVMRYFGGLKREEIADVLGKHVSTVSSYWVYARAFLKRELGIDDADKK